MSLNFSKVPKSGWFLLGSIVLIMVLALIFKPVFAGWQGIVIATVFLSIMGRIYIKYFT